MRLRVICLLVITCFTAISFAAENVVINYSYEGDHRVNLSKLSRGPLKIAEFTDSRSGADPLLITDKDLGDGAGGYLAEKPLAAIVGDAIRQGMLKGNAALVDSGENLRLEGSIVSSDAQIVTTDGKESIQLTLRTEVKLQGPGRTIWQTVLFGRGTASREDGIEAALREALDRTIRGLVQDDYFLNEIL